MGRFRQTHAIDKMGGRIGNLQIKKEGPCSPVQEPSISAARGRHKQRSETHSRS